MRIPRMHLIGIPQRVNYGWHFSNINGNSQIQGAESSSNKDK